MSTATLFNTAATPATPAGYTLLSYSLGFTYSPLVLDGVMTEEQMQRLCTALGEDSKFRPSDIAKFSLPSLAERELAAIQVLNPLTRLAPWLKTQLHKLDVEFACTCQETPSIGALCSVEDFVQAFEEARMRALAAES